MRQLFLTLSVLLVAGALIGAVSLYADDEEQEQEVALAQVPKAVKDAATKAVEGLEISEAEVEAILIYEVEGKADGKEYELLVTAEGKVLERIVEEKDDDCVQEESEDEEEDEAEHELEIPLSAVPAKVKAAAEKAVKGIELSEAEVSAVLVYEVEGKAGGREVEVEVTSTGKVIEIEREKDDDD